MSVPANTKISPRWLVGLVLLGSLVAILLFLGYYPNILHQGPRFRLLHITDTHVCFLDGLHPVISKARAHYRKAQHRLERFIRSIPSQVKAQALIITGDLVDFWAAPDQNGALQTRQLEHFLTSLRPLPLPCWLTLGNHDFYSYTVTPQQQVRFHQKAVRTVRRTWRRAWPCFQQGTYYTRVCQVGPRCYHLIFLDNGDFQVALPGLPRGELDQYQLQWLQEQLNQARQSIVLLFMHIGVPVGDTNQDGIHFPSPPKGWPYPDTYQHGLMHCLNAHANIKAIFVGHQHKDIIEQIPLPAGHHIWQIETAALGDDENHWRVIDLEPNAIKISASGSSRMVHTIALASKTQH